VGRVEETGEVEGGGKTLPRKAGVRTEHLTACVRTMLGWLSPLLRTASVRT
jgi:hypothetical protein